MSAPTYSVTVPGTGTETLGHLRLGAYRATEPALEGASVTAGDGVYLMTSAAYTTDVEGAVYVEAGNGMSVTGNASASITAAGETSLRAMTVGIAASRSPETGDTNITLESENDATLEAGTGIEITCQRLVYVVNQNLTISRKAKGSSHYGSQTSFTLGGKTGIYAVNNTDITGALRWEPRIYDHKFALADFSSVIVKGTGELMKSENFGLRTFLVGLFLPVKAAEAKAVVAEDRMEAVSVESTDLRASQTGARSETGVVSASSANLESS